MPAKDPMPGWLKDRIEVLTGLDLGGGFGRVARLRRCPRCGLSVWQGLDSKVAAVSATVDAMPLDALGEYLAVAAGRRTRTLHCISSEPEIGWRRRADDIAGSPTGTGRYAVMVEHECGASHLSVDEVAVQRIWPRKVLSDGAIPY